MIDTTIKDITYKVIKRKINDIKLRETIDKIKNKKA